MLRIKAAFVASLAMVGLGLAGGTVAVAQLSIEKYLSETKYLNYSHPDVQRAIADAIDGAETNREKAIAIHDYVRDRIIFGFSPPFYDMTASEVLAAGKGFCNNQSTVFAAMLRGAGIPARHRFFSLSAQVLDGVIDPGTRYVDHAVVEVRLDDVWIPVDSYIVDREHARMVQPLLADGMRYGMRANASSDWDGRTPSYSQFDAAYVEKEFGVFEDVGTFYDQVEEANNRFGYFERILFPLAIGGANDNIRRIRAGNL